MRASVIVISGPSAVGKSRVIKEVLKCEEKLKFITSYTTRAPRESEEEGRDYCFIKEEEFLYLIEAGEMLEWKKMNSYYYGTPKQDFMDFIDKGYTLLLDIEPQGFDKIKRKFTSVYGIYLLPESLSVLYDQIISRGIKRGIKNINDADLRFKDSLSSIRMAGIYDLVVINKKVSETAQLIVNWINIVGLQKGREELLADWSRENGLLP